MSNNDKLNYLDILEQYMLSEYYPKDIFINTNYTTDESYDDNMVMCYVDVSQEVYNNFNTNYNVIIDEIKNSFNQYLIENNIDLDINDFDCTTLSDELAVSFTIENEDIDYPTYESRLKSIEERWDPSMSNSPDAPWNQSSFLDEYDTELDKYFDKLGYDSDELNDLYHHDIVSDLETDVENKFQEFYDSYFMSSSDDGLSVTPLYKTLEKEITDSIGYGDYKLLRKTLKTKLFNYVLDNNLNVFKEIYDKYLKQIGYSTNEELKQVQAGEIVKLQRPLDNTYSDITTDENGVEIGNCDDCNAPGVDISNHICKTLLQDDNGNNMVTTIESFRLTVLLEQDKKKIKNDINGEIEYQANSLIKKYQNQFMDEIQNIYPNYKEDEHDDAIDYIIDFIYDMEDIDDSMWNKIKLSIEDKLKTILL